MKLKKLFIIVLITLAALGFTTCELENQILKSWWQDDPDYEFQYVPIVKYVPQIYYEKIIETKYEAHINDVPKVLKKAETFRILCPDHKDFKIYLGLASMVFYPELEQTCKEEGIAIIKQVGDMVVIDDGHLRVF